MERCREGDMEEGWRERVLERLCTVLLKSISGQCDGVDGVRGGDEGIGRLSEVLN